MHPKIWWFPFPEFASLKSNYLKRQLFLDSSILCFTPLQPQLFQVIRRQESGLQSFAFTALSPSHEDVPLQFQELLVDIAVVVSLNVSELGLVLSAFPIFIQVRFPMFESFCGHFFEFPFCCPCHNAMYTSMVQSNWHNIVMPYVCHIWFWITQNEVQLYPGFVKVPLACPTIIYVMRICLPAQNVKPILQNPICQMYTAVVPATNTPPTQGVQVITKLHTSNASVEVASNNNATRCLAQPVQHRIQQFVHPFNRSIVIPRSWEITWQKGKGQSRISQL